MSLLLFPLMFPSVLIGTGRYAKYVIESSDNFFLVGESKSILGGTLSN